MVMLLTGLSLGAQESPWRVGAFGMLGKSKFTFTDTPTDYTNKFAFQSGVYGQYARPKGHIAFRVGLGYSHTKGGYNGATPDINFPGLPSISGDPYKAYFEYSHIVLPMEMLLDLGKDPATGFYVLFGPTLQFQVKRRAERTVYYYGIPQTNDISDSADRNLDLLGEFGLGYAFSLGPGYYAFVQPMVSTNIPGNVLDFLAQEKGGAHDHITTYVYGIAFGVSLGL